MSIRSWSTVTKSWLATSESWLYPSGRGVCHATLTIWLNFMKTQRAVSWRKTEINLWDVAWKQFSWWPYPACPLECAWPHLHTNPTHLSDVLKAYPSKNPLLRPLQHSLLSLYSNAGSRSPLSQALRDETLHVSSKAKSARGIVCLANMLLSNKSGIWLGEGRHVLCRMRQWAGLVGQGRTEPHELQIVS